MPAEIKTPVGDAPVVPLVVIGTGLYLAWFGVHYFKQDVKWPTDPIKNVLQGRPVPAQQRTQPTAAALLSAETSAASLGDTGGGGGTSAGGAPVGTGSGRFRNPIGAGFIPARIDMGVDYTGAGPLYALGDGSIVNVYNSGWPGGTFIGLHLSDVDRYVFYAENIAPTVKVGQKVKAGDVVGMGRGSYPFIEVGWAAPPGTGQTMAAAAGQQSHSGDPGERPTGYGVAFSDVIVSLGGPAGIKTGQVSGTVDPAWHTADGVSTGTGQAPGSKTAAGRGSA